MSNTRIAILELAARHRLDATALSSLWKLAALGQQPPLLLPHLRRYLALSAAFLGGLGLVCMIAANWSTLGRVAQFALLQFLVIACFLGTSFSPKARQPLALFSLLSVGGLLAYFGQTYQTGADPWQLFALWAALTLLLALAVRSDMVWTAWVIVAAMGICLWGEMFDAPRFSSSADKETHLWAAVMMSGLTAILRVLPSKHTGAGVWCGNLSLLFAVAMTSLVGLEYGENESFGYALALGLHVCALLMFSQRTFFDVLSISITAVGLNVLVLCQVFFRLWSLDNLIGFLFVTVVVATCTLSATLWLIQSRHRHFQQSGDRQ